MPAATSDITSRAHRGLPAAQQRGGWMAAEQAGTGRELNDDRVLLQRGPDQPVLQRHLDAGGRVAGGKVVSGRVAGEELGRSPIR